MVRLEGLSQEEVAKKIQEGKQNKVTIKTEKSIGQIIRDNVFTYFNLIFLVLAVLLVAVKSWNNLLFVPVVVVNSLVGIVQEVRSRRILRQMQFLHMSEAIVLREREKKSLYLSISWWRASWFTFKLETRSMRMGSCWRAS